MTRRPFDPSTVVAAVRRIAGQLEHGPDDVHLAHLPLPHGFALMMRVTALPTFADLKTKAHVEQPA
jgi:long-subunit acyl-CoA synthetase (AMP-forming)